MQLRFGRGLALSDLGQSIVRDSLDLSEADHQNLARYDGRERVSDNWLAKSYGGVVAGTY